MLAPVVFGLLAPVCVAIAPSDAVVVTTFPLAQKSSYHFFTASISDCVLQLCAPQTSATPVVPSLSKTVSRESVQKQFSSTAVVAGGEHLPCTSKRGPHREAQAGRPELKGTITPSGEAAPAAAVAVVVCADTEDMIERRVKTRVAVGGRIVKSDILWRVVDVISFVCNRNAASIPILYRSCSSSFSLAESVS